MNDTNKCLEFLKNNADLEAKDENGWNSLHYACLNGNFRLVNLLLFKEANIDSETTFKLTPLMIASQK